MRATAWNPPVKAGSVVLWYSHSTHLTLPSEGLGLWLSGSLPNRLHCVPSIAKRTKFFQPTSGKQRHATKFPALL